MNRPNLKILGQMNLTVSPNFSLCLPTLELVGPGIIGVVGANGAGKSTLLKVFADLLPSGLKSLVERRPSAAAWMPTQTLPAFECSVLELVLMGRYPLHKGNPTREDREHCLQILENFGIARFASHNYQTLSSGEQRKASLARTIAAERQILLLDEPMSHLDPKASLEILRLLKKIKQEGKLIILSIHDLNLAIKLCDEILFMKSGQLLTSAKVRPGMDLTPLKETFEIEFRYVSDGTETYIVPKENLI